MGHHRPAGCPAQNCVARHIDDARGRPRLARAFGAVHQELVYGQRSGRDSNFIDLAVEELTGVPGRKHGVTDDAADAQTPGSIPGPGAVCALALQFPVDIDSHRGGGIRFVEHGRNVRPFVGLHGAGSGRCGIPIGVDGELDVAGVPQVDVVLSRTAPVFPHDHALAERPRIDERLDGEGRDRAQVQRRVGARIGDHQADPGVVLRNIARIVLEVCAGPSRVKDRIRASIEHVFGRVGPVRRVVELLRDVAPYNVRVGHDLLAGCPVELPVRNRIPPGRTRPAQDRQNESWNQPSLAHNRPPSHPYQGQRQDGSSTVARR